MHYLIPTPLPPRACAAACQNASCSEADLLPPPSPPTPLPACPALPAAKFDAVDVFDHNAQLAALRARAVHELVGVDMLLVPSALTHFTKAEVRACAWARAGARAGAPSAHALHEGRGVCLCVCRVTKLLHVYACISIQTCAWRRTGGLMRTVEGRGG